MATNYNIQYNIPRVQVQLSGRQNRLTDGRFRVTPSMTEPVKFLLGNQDGVALGLIGFKMHFVVWKKSILDYDNLTVGSSDVILNKMILVDDPYSGEVEMVLTETDTLIIGNHSSGRTLNWSLFMVNADGEVFPAQVSRDGGRVGSIIVDLQDATPLAEIIRTPIA